MAPRDKATVLDVLNAAKLACEFVAGYTKEGFLADPKTQSAVLHQLLIIGEVSAEV